MPEEMFKERVFGKDLTKDLLTNLAETFLVSLTAAALRFVIMRPEYALVCSSAKGILWYEKDNDNFPYYINTHGKLHRDSLAADFFAGQSLPECPFPVEPHAWLDLKYPLRETFKELAIPLPRYGQILSFLFLDE